jgi:hypothetical protein
MNNDNMKIDSLVTISSKHFLAIGGFFLIEVDMFNHNSIKFILDTGADGNMLDEWVYECFKKEVPDIETLIEGNTTATSLEGTSGGIILNIPFVFENQEYNEQFLVSNNLSELLKKFHSDFGLQVHGILGNGFLCKHGWILDFERMVVCKREIIK